MGGCRIYCAASLCGSACPIRETKFHAGKLGRSKRAMIVIDSSALLAAGAAGPKNWATKLGVGKRRTEKLTIS
jgi:hypothetical protein